MTTINRLSFILLVLAMLFTGCDDGSQQTRDVVDQQPDEMDVPDLEPDADPDTDTGPDASPDGSADYWDVPDIPDPPADGAYLNVLQSTEDYALLQGADANLKYLYRVRGVDPMEPLVAPCYFQNMTMFEWHLLFLHYFPELADLSFETYTSLVLREESRIWWGGELRAWPGVVHPQSEETGIYSYTIYSDSNAGSGLTLEDIVEVDRTTKFCMPYAEDLVVFVPSDPFQQDAVRQMEDELEEAGVAVLFPNQLVEGISSIGYSLGEGYGTLRIVPEGQLLTEYGPRDVVIAQSAPNDISIVSGLITAEPQNPASHVNLRLQEKGIPNASIPDIYENAFVRTLEDRLVHVVVDEDSVTIEPATLAEAEAFWEANRPGVPQPVSDLMVTALGPYDTIGADDAIVYGAKAANLAEIRNILPPENRVEGFGIPFSRYVEHVETNQIDGVIDRILNDERLYTDAAWKRDELERIRDLIEAAPLVPEFETTLHDQLRATWGQEVETMPIRFRSSTNVEDLDELTGAGLYESRRGCLADDLDSDGQGPSLCLESAEAQFLSDRLTDVTAEYAMYPERFWLADIIDDIDGDLNNEKAVARAVRKVWASLWNERAFDEREYYGIDHREAYMGVAVNPSFVLEQVNAVAFTNLDGGGGNPVYRVVSQVGVESVVRPDDPTVVAEVLTFRRGPNDEVEDVNVQIQSSLADGQDLWSQQQLETLAGLLFTIQDHFQQNVYPDASPLRLDVEIKIDRDGNVVIKQARPYVTFDP